MAMRCWAYFTWCLLRIFLTLLPQTGYIHPDEFFQSTEILAGRVFNFETYTPWEFNSTIPIRSMALPSITIGLPYLAMKYLAQYIQEFSSVSILQPYFLVTIPRVVMTLLSFISDYFIYKICTINGLRPWSTLLVFSNSHVVFTFMTRTFSNNYELILFTVLLYLVSDAMNLTDKFIREEIELEKQYKEAAYALERVKIFRKQKKIPMHKYNHSLWIGGLFALGMFNRPTFMLYAVIPMFFWMQRGMFLKKVGLTDFHLRMTSLLPSFIMISFLLVLSDTLFYGVSEPFLKLSTGKMVMTPLNFIAYNMDQTNLARHGLHPWYLHSAVNVPILFNVLGLGGLYLMSRALVVIIGSSWNTKPDLFNFNGLAIFSFAFPLVTLSLTPHQEPRFLLPLLVPLVLLLGPLLLRKQGFWPKIARSLWYSANVVCILFFGFFHQGGIYGAQNYFHQYIHQHRPSLTNTHLIYFHTYMPPMSLLALPDRTASVVKANGTRYRRGQSVFVEDMAGAPWHDLEQRCTHLVQEARSKWLRTKMQTEIFSIVPGTLASKMDRMFLHQPSIRWISVRKFHPHLSMEDPPHFGDICSSSSTSTDTETTCQSFTPWLHDKWNQLALIVYRLEFSLR